MKYNQLNISSKKHKRIVGRGISAGRGKTAGRGTKGQNSRTGSKRNPLFSGGQTPIMQQLPKLKGFKSKKAKLTNLTTDKLNELPESIIDTSVLVKYNLIANPYLRIKLLNGSKFTTAKEINLYKASKAVIIDIQEAGGVFNKTNPPLRTKKSQTK